MTSSGRKRASTEAASESGAAGAASGSVAARFSSKVVAVVVVVVAVLIRNGLVSLVVGVSVVWMALMAVKCERRSYSMTCGRLVTCRAW